MILPVYNQFNNTWIITDENGNQKTISNDEYIKNFKKQFKTRYDNETIPRPT